MFEWGKSMSNRCKVNIVLIISKDAKTTTKSDKSCRSMHIPWCALKLNSIPTNDHVGGGEGGVYKSLSKIKQNY